MRPFFGVRQAQIKCSGGCDRRQARVGEQRIGRPLPAAKKRRGLPPALRNRDVDFGSTYQSMVALNLNRRPFMIPVTEGYVPGSV